MTRQTIISSFSVLVAIVAVVFLTISHIKQSEETKRLIRANERLERQIEESAKADKLSDNANKLRAEERLARSRTLFDKLLNTIQQTGREPTTLSYKQTDQENKNEFIRIERFIESQRVAIAALVSELVENGYEDRAKLEPLISKYLKSYWMLKFSSYSVTSSLRSGSIDKMAEESKEGMKASNEMFDIQNKLQELAPKP